MITVDFPDSTGTAHWTTCTATTAGTATTITTAETAVVAQNWDELDACQGEDYWFPAPWEDLLPALTLRSPEPNQNRTTRRPPYRRQGQRRTATGARNFRRAA